MSNSVESGPVRQYKMFFRPKDQKNFVPVEPGVHKVIYDAPAAQEGVRALREFHALEAAVVHVNDGLLNIVAFNSDQLDPFGWVL